MDPTQVPLQPVSAVWTGFLFFSRISQQSYTFLKKGRADLLSGISTFVVLSIPTTELEVHLLG